MTKAEIVQALYTRVGGFSKKESADIVDLIFEMMKETLGRGEIIRLPRMPFRWTMTRHFSSLTVNCALRARSLECW